MKIAISIPDEVFAEGERLAKQLNTSRSNIYARALSAFAGNHQPDRVTEAINAVVDAVGPSSDEFSRAAARRIFAKTEW